MPKSLALCRSTGAYNALLNTTSKFRASLAACLTILSYMATAVLSANEAMHYAHNLWSVFPVIPATILLLALFMCITILGITESAHVAVVIFIIHFISLAVLIVTGILYLILNGAGTLAANMQTPNENGLLIALFFGFSAAMLGISGFESSANFVEEQAEGVFPKTLRNMWVAVSILNPGTVMLALSLIPMAQIPRHEEALLAHMGSVAAGPWLSWLISIDATLVLSGDISKKIISKIEDINAQQIVFFTRGDNLANLKSVMLYVRNNEHTNRIKVVIVVKKDSDVPPNLKEDLKMLDQAYPEIDIEFVVVKGTFGPELIRSLSKKWSIPTNLMFIGSPGDHFMYGLAGLGGVRLII